MAPKAGGELHPLRQLKSPKALQPMLALVSFEADEEQ